MNRVICDHVAIYRDWASVFARFGYRIDLVDDIDDNPYFDSEGRPVWWATLTYWKYDLLETAPQELFLDTGDWGMSLTGDPAKRHIDLLNLEQFLIRRGLPWIEPVDPLHELIRAARLLPFCASVYTASDRAAVFHAWLGRMRDLAADLFDDDQEAEEFAYVFDAATDRLGDRAAALASRMRPAATLRIPEQHISADAAVWTSDDHEEEAP